MTAPTRSTVIHGRPAILAPIHASTPHIRPRLAHSKKTKSPRRRGEGFSFDALGARGWGRASMEILSETRSHCVGFSTVPNAIDIGTWLGKTTHWSRLL